ncbi:MAG: hypothetical protein K2W95_32760 [Candidatus Obscuribacterales bacterium]|nr:hypothetical protein [Candidatus Obscuribacterales bacterium]
MKTNPIVVQLYLITLCGAWAWCFLQPPWENFGYSPIWQMPFDRREYLCIDWSRLICGVIGVSLQITFCFLWFIKADEVRIWLRSTRTRSTSVQHEEQCASLERIDTDNKGE